MPNLSRLPPHMFTSTYNRALHQLTTDSPKFDNGHPFYPRQCHLSLEAFFAVLHSPLHYNTFQCLLQNKLYCIQVVVQIPQVQHCDTLQWLVTISGMILTGYENEECEQNQQCTYYFRCSSNRASGTALELHFSMFVLETTL